MDYQPTNFSDIGALMSELLTKLDISSILLVAFAKWSNDVTLKISAFRLAPLRLLIAARVSDVMACVEFQSSATFAPTRGLAHLARPPLAEEAARLAERDLAFLAVRIGRSNRMIPRMARLLIRAATLSLGRHSGTKNRTTRGAEFAHVCGAGRRWRVCGAGRRWRGGTVLARPVIRKLTIAQVLFGLHCVESPENVREVFAHAADSIHGVVAELLDPGEPLVHLILQLQYVHLRGLHAGACAQPGDATCVSLLVLGVVPHHFAAGPQEKKLRDERATRRQVCLHVAGR